MGDPVPLLNVDIPAGYKTLHRILVALLLLGSAGALLARVLFPHAPDPKINLITPSGLVVGATFLFTAGLVAGPYRRGLLYKIARGTWPPGAESAPDADRLARAYGTRAAAPWGFIAATGLFDAVCYGVQGSWENLAVTLGSLALLVALSPTRRRCERFVRDGLPALARLRAGP